MKTLFQSCLIRVFFSFAFLLPPFANADLFLFEKFTDKAASPGWARDWEERQGLAPGENGLAGQGKIQRQMARGVDFSTDGEWFFSLKLRRHGAGKGGESDHATVTLLKGKGKRPEDRLMSLGISSRDAFFVSLGDSEITAFGAAEGGPEYTMILRLRTSVTKPDEIAAWTWPSHQVPDQIDWDKPMAREEMLLDGAGNLLRFSTGPKAGFSAEFQELRMGETADDVTMEHPVLAKAPSPYRVFRSLRVTENGVHALPIQWANASVLPSSPGRAPRLVVSSNHPWLSENVVTFDPATALQKSSAVPAPNPRLPLYGPAKPGSPLPKGDYRSIPNAKGGFDVFDLRRLEQTAEIGPDGVLSVLSTPREILLGEAGEENGREEFEQVIPKESGAEFFLGDADGDSIPDLLIGKMTSPEEKWTYWPNREQPWVTEERQNIGPDRDLAVSEGFRGYGINGEWLGTRRTKMLLWARGSRDKGKLRFGIPRPVFYGRDDFPVQSRDYSHRMAPAILERNGERSIVLFTGVDQAFALPVIEANDGELRCGSARPLLREGEPLQDLILPKVVGVNDVTGDGNNEILVGSGANGRLAVLGGGKVGDFEVLGTLETLGGPLAADTLSVPARADWTGDGRPDLVTGDGTGYYLLWPGTDDPLVYEGSRPFSDAAGKPLVFKGTTNLQGPHERGWSYSQPALCDWNADGVLEMIGNDNTSTLRLYSRIDQDMPWRVKEKIFTQNGKKFGVAWRSRVAGLPGNYRLAGDDRPVLLYTNLEQQLAMAIPKEKGGTEIERTLLLQGIDGEPIVTAGFAGMSGRTQLSAVDWDGDGVWDIVYNSPPRNIPVFYNDAADLSLNSYYNSAAAFWLRNAGTNERPVFEKPRRIRWADGEVIRVESHSFNVEPTDLNGDGKLDLIVGDGPGFLHYFLRDDLSWDH